MAAVLDVDRLLQRSPELVATARPGEHQFRGRGLKLDDATAAALAHFAEPRTIADALADADQRRRIPELLDRGLLVFHDVDWVITGCGRSGTKYIAELLTRSGRDIAHESMGRHGIASWMWAVDARAVPWGPAPSVFRHSRERCFHQVREPLAAIASLQTFADLSWQFIAAHTGSAADAPILLRSARYWLEWNRLAEQRSSWRYRIEDIATVYPSLCERMSIEPDARSLAEVPRSVNTRKGLFATVGWDDIARLDEQLAADAREQARTYGYV